MKIDRALLRFLGELLYLIFVMKRKLPAYDTKLGRNRETGVGKLGWQGNFYMGF